MATSIDTVETALIEELRALLARLVPDEAAWAPEYARTAGSSGARERAFGIPGGGVELVLGAFLAQAVLEVAKSFVEALKKEGAERAAKAVIDWLAAKLGKKPPEVAKPTGEETLESIQRTLVRAGWSDRDAKLAAEETWLSGERTGQRLVVLASR